MLGTGKAIDGIFCHKSMHCGRYMHRERKRHYQGTINCTSKHYE